MREIKFRAWDKENKKMSKPFGLFDIYAGRDEAYLPDYTRFGEDNLIIQQYTGLKDKNGEEIYEGDILKCIGWQREEFVTKVYYDTNRAKFDIKKDDLENFTISQNNWTLEIIGNIYENPELIK